MANELTIVSDNWLELAGSGGGLPMPFAQEIFLLACQVAGTTHINDILVKTENVGAGTLLQLRRDPTNEHDDAAIAVCTAKGDRIGWVPRRQNGILSRLMDGGKQLIAKVVSKKLKDHYLDMQMEIILKDI